MLRRSRLRLLACALSLLGLILIVHRTHSPCVELQLKLIEELEISKRVNKLFFNWRRQFETDSPLIFVGGVPGSGTTLARAILDSHPEIRCGAETHVIPWLLNDRLTWKNSAVMAERLLNAGVNDRVLDEAIAAFILEVIVRHGELAPRLCNKDPMIFQAAGDLARMFPNAKFILLVRDGRATVNSIISRGLKAGGYDLSNYSASLERWNADISDMFLECLKLGLEKCLPVRYENLVLQPRGQIGEILEFINVPWNESVLYHHRFINKPGGVYISKLGRSNSEVVKPINMLGLSKWVSQIPDDVIDNIEKLAPMLETLGYNPYENPPLYGDPEQMVIRNTELIRENPRVWVEIARKISDGESIHISKN